MRKMFNIVVTAPVSRVTVPFVHIWTISYRPLNGVLYLNFVFFYHDLISNSIIVVNSSRVFADYVFSIWYCLLCRMYLKYAMWFIGSIMYRPKTSRPGLLPLALWYVGRTTKAVATRISIHGSELSTYVSCRLYVITKLPSTWCILSMVEFTCGLPGEAGLVLILY